MVFGEQELRAECNGNLSQSIGQVFGRVCPPEILDRLEESLLEASRLLGLPADPDWEIRANTAWTLRNRYAAERAYPVRLAVVAGRVSRPTLRWPQGELAFAGELEPGDALRIEPGPRATLERGGQRRDVSAQWRGELPTVPPRSTIVVQYDSRLPSRHDRVRVAMGASAATATPSPSVEQRRLLWVRRFLEVCEIGDYGFYASPAGPVALARTAQRWFDKVPEQAVARVQKPPPFDLTGTDEARVFARTATHFAPARTVRVPPSRAVNTETGGDAACRTREAGHNLYAGSWTGTHTRLAGYEALLRFDVAGLAPNETILRATCHGYIEGQLNEVYVTGVGVSYSPQDDWDADAAALERKPTLLESEVVLGAGNNGGNANVWFTSDVTRHIRRPEEGPGQPLTLGLTSSGHSGIRGLAVAGPARGELAPYLQLEVGEVDLVAPPFWDALLATPKQALGDGLARELRAELARRHVGRDYRWSPPLAFLWEYRDPPARRGRLVLE